MVHASFARSAAVPMAHGDDAAGERMGWRPNVRHAVGKESRAVLVVWGALLGVLGVCVVLGSVWVRTQVVEVGYRLSGTRQLVERLELEERELAVRAAAADTDGRLEERAATRLGMRPPHRGEEDGLP